MTDLSKKQRKALEWSALPGGWHWRDAPKQFTRLETLGLVRLQIPQNPAHLERAVVTEKGKELLR